MRHVEPGLRQEILAILAGADDMTIATVREESQASLQHYTCLSIDRAFKANLARLTLGISPVALAQPHFDWLAHLVTAPGKQMQLVENVAHIFARLAAYVAQAVLRLRSNGTYSWSLGKKSYPMLRPSTRKSHSL